MRIFKYWVAPEVRFEQDGVTFAGRCFGGSNTSDGEAAEDARSRWQGVVERIQGRRGGRSPDYVADIREEVLREIDANNIVTRNRYGAEVLNSADHMILDVDQPPWSWRDLFGPKPDIKARQERIISNVRKVAATPVLSTAAIRIYLTPRGIRLMLTGVEHSPRSEATRRLMGSLNVDRLYMRLCGKQDCYRARLTPKPSGIGMKTPRCLYPRDEALDRNIREWVAAYDAKRSGFAACRLLETLGAFTSSAVSDFHDQRCRSNEALPLA